MQLYMEDIRDEGAEHGINVQLLEATEQGTEASKAEIPSVVVQPSIQKLGKQWDHGNIIQV